MFEAVVGYPQWLWRAIGHPVSWIGRIINWSDRRFNVAGISPGNLRLRGAAFVVALLFLVGIAGGVIQAALSYNLVAFAVLAILSSSLFAQRSLHAHVAAVAGALDRGLEEGRAAVAKIVGRDVAKLDEAGIARAAIESLAENFSDGVVAPAFWMALAGLPGGALYKTINTADSMIGHVTPRHADFGRAAARIDDVVNWPAARLAGLLIVIAAELRRGASAERAWGTMRRDAPKHRSPNAGWPEAAMAGALGLRLAGPRSYEGVQVEDHFMGDGRFEAGAQDIRDALALYRRAALLLWLLLALLALVLL